MRIPEPLTSKSGLTLIATRGRIPRRCPIPTSRRASVTDSISTVTPAATAWRNSAGALPGPGETDRARRHRGVQGSPELEGGGDVEGIDQAR